MIFNITDKIYIRKVDPLNWCVAERKVSVEKEIEREKMYGYFPTVQMAFKAAVTRFCLNETQTTEEFKELLDKLLQLESQF